MQMYTLKDKRRSRLVNVDGYIIVINMTTIVQQIKAFYNNNSIFQMKVKYNMKVGMPSQGIDKDGEYYMNKNI